MYYRHVKTGKLKPFSKVAIYYVFMHNYITLC